ncbi:MAG: Lrp/AsnC ligand binding domain-containing protein [Desulfobacterales bacterium]
MKMGIFHRLRRCLSFQKPPDEVKSFCENQESESAFDTIDRGTQFVPLDRIVGSVGRYHDFDSRFRPKNHLPTDRYQGIRNAFKEGRRLPPVRLYQIKDEFYVLDGNHRISAAKELKHTEIEASIVEFIPSGNTLENLLYRQRAGFSEKTGLAYAITLTEVGQYDHLLGQIASHRRHLEQTGGKSVAFEVAAADWYETIYRPLVAIIRRGNLISYFPGRTLDDLYAYISLHQWEEGRKRKYGIGIDKLIPKDMEAFRDHMTNRDKSDYPEMLREITAFVLMNVKGGKNEHRIMEKLYSLKEIREIHSIHGNVDILIKVVLTRDLLSSDAEIISEFVHDQLRQIPGVLSTQTLIPGRSMIKG